MGAWETSLIGLAALFGMMALGMPIAFAMMIAGAGGLYFVLGPGAFMGMMGQIPFSSTTSYELSVVPMFLLMGAFVTRAGMSRDLYDACYGFVGNRRGGLAMATVMACGGFSAVSGSSIATAATMARVSMPAMRAYGYTDALAGGAIAAGGTLGILIPPSVILVLYGVMTGTDIGHLFIAGVIPGLIAILFYVLAVSAFTWLYPETGPKGQRCDWRERLRRLGRVGPVLGLFVIIIGGIYGGVFTPTEAAGVGAFGALLFALWRRALSVGRFRDALKETARTTAMLFIVLVGALIFSNFINVAGLPRALADLIQSAGLSPLGVILMMVVVYVILGCFLESLSMMLLTVPIFFPIAMALGFDPVWFGILIVMVTEMSLITPPVGMNLFVLKGAIGDIRLGALYRGVTPFLIADLLRIILIIAVPAVVLFLPGLARI